MLGVEEYFGALGTVRRVEGRSLTAADLEHVDVLLVRSVTKVGQALLAGSPVRFVGTATSGFDHIDLNYLADNGIGFSHAPGSNANSVVEYVLAAIASTENKLEQLMAGSRLGIVGFGNIGSALARRCDALGIDYRVYDPWLEQSTVSNAASLEQVLACDVISLHPELGRTGAWPSYHLLGEDELAGLSPRALMINASRGGIVDNDALLRLRQRGLGPTSVLDVWEGEPAISAQLLRLVALGTAHIAGYSTDGKYRATKMLRDAAFVHLGLEAGGEELTVDLPTALEVPPALSGAALVRWALGTCYDILEDNALLRGVTLGPSTDEAAAGFDALRKNYRRRRELMGCTARTVAQQSDQAGTLTAMGLVLDEISGIT